LLSWSDYELIGEGRDFISNGLVDYLDGAGDPGWVMDVEAEVEGILTALADGAESREDVFYFLERLLELAVMAAV
jgi:hypothetical protein